MDDDDVISKRNAPSFSHFTDEWEPTNPGLWERVLDVARGKRLEFSQQERTIHAPNDGRGFLHWPNPRGMGWAVKQYNGFNGQWKLREKKASVEKTSERLTKEWLMAVRRGWLQTMKPPIHDFPDVLKAVTKLKEFSTNLKDQVLNVRRGPYTSYPSMSDHADLLKAFKRLDDNLSNAQSTAQYWYDCYEGKIPFPTPSARTEGEHMLALYTKDFEAATQGYVGTGQRARNISLIELFDGVLKVLYADAKRLTEYYDTETLIRKKREENGEELEPFAHPDVTETVFKEFSLGRLKLVVLDPKTSGHRILAYVKIADKAQQLLNRKGFGKVWYGTMILASGDFKELDDYNKKAYEAAGYVNLTSVAGEFHGGADIVKLFSPADENLAETICHEMGHRWWAKFLTAEQRGQFTRDFEAGVLPVSTYGKNNEREAFAEVFAFYCFGKDLTREQNEKFRSVLSSSNRRETFLADEWQTLEMLRQGSVHTTLEGAPNQDALHALRARGFVRQTSRGTRHYWDITKKGYVVVTAGLGDELQNKMDDLLQDFSQDAAKTLGVWLETHFRVKSPKTPKGGKELKEQALRLTWVLQHRMTSGGSLEATKAEVAQDWEPLKARLKEFVTLFTEEGGKVVPKEITLSYATYLNNVGVDEATLLKYANRLEAIFAKIHGWRSKALAGTLKVALSSPRDFHGTMSGKYKWDQDTLMVRTSPSILNRDSGYASFEYIIVHELGHRYERFHSTPDCDRREWQTTRYSLTEGEAFAELFAIGHFKLTGSWDSGIVDRFEKSVAV